MYCRRTLSCNNDVIPAKAAGSTTPWYRSLGLAVALFGLLILIGPGVAAQPVVIEIENTPPLDSGATAWVDVTLSSAPDWFEMAGFDLLVAYDTPRISLVSVSQGGLLDSCGWEYFVYQVGPEADCGGQPCPEGFIRMVGVADLASAPGSPTCYADTTGTLARMEFLVSFDTADHYTLSNVQFVWYDCGDNSLASVSGDSLFISEMVYDPWDWYQPLETAFPTRWGAPDTCLTDSNSILRRVEYHHGMVDFFFPFQVKPGDINMNNVAFEIADWVLFGAYFMNGLEVFTIDIEDQVGASDVNLDGVPLTLQDLTYMYSYIHDGPDVPHNPPDASDTVFFSQDTEAKTVSLSYPDTIQAVYLVFDGHLKPWGEETWAYDGQYTRILIGRGMWPWNDSTIFEQDSLFYYTGEGSFLAAYAAFDGYTPIPTAIVGFAGDCCLDKGNVDNDPSGELNIADLVYLVEYMFVDGPEPPCMRQADVIEDWSIDIADLVFLVDYMFNGGPAAPACP